MLKQLANFIFIFINKLFDCFLCLLLVCGSRNLFAQEGDSAAIYGNSANSLGVETKPNQIKFPAQVGSISSAEAYIFQEANFDASIITILKRGLKVFISTQKTGPFYKIQMADGSIAYVLDSDAKPTGEILSPPETRPTLSKPPIPPKFESSRMNEPDAKKLDKNNSSANPLKELKDTGTQFKQEQRNPPKTSEVPVNRVQKSSQKAERPSPPLDPPKKSIASTRYRGIGLEQVNFQEETIQKTRSESLLFYGLKLSGVNTGMVGLYTDVDFLYHSGAPSYYADKTGNSSSGFLMIIDFIFESTHLLSRDSMYFFGFGPVLRYSHYDVGLTESGRSVSYSLDDMVLGGVFNLGLTTRFSRFSVRPEVKYYWEKKQYTSLGLAFQIDF